MAPESALSNQQSALAFSDFLHLHKVFRG